MKYTAKITKNGTSFFLLVPSNIRKILELKKGDIIEVDIQKINDDIVMIRYKCNVCELTFDSDDEHPYCPGCGIESVQEINNEIQEVMEEEDGRTK